MTFVAFGEVGGEDWRAGKWGLSRLACQEIPSSHRFEDGELRVICIGQTFASLVGRSFDEIRASSDGNVAIMLRMLGALETIASLTDATDRRRVLQEQVEYIAESAERTLVAPRVRDRFEVRLAEVRDVLNADPSLIR